jgi:hypothetical protein
MNFSEIWERVKMKTEMKTFTELASLVGTTSQYVSRKKKENDFPVTWAYEIAQKNGLSTDWIMTGRSTKKHEEANEKRQFEIFNQAEEWLTEEVKKNPKKEIWFEVEFEKAFQEFKEWKEGKEKSEAKEAYSTNRKVA